MANQQIEKFRKLAKKGSEPELSRTDESEILKWLHATAKRNLFSEASWPANDETKRTYWFIFKECLSISPTEGCWILTKFAQEIDIVSLGAFIGVDLESCLGAFDWDKSGEADLQNLLDDLCEAHLSEDRANELTKRYLRGAYKRYCTAHGIRSFESIN